MTKKELRQKIENLHISLRAKDVKIKNQATSITELNRVYGVANNTVAEQIEVIAMKNRVMDRMEEHYDSHMEIAEKAIARLHVIINYLETKDI